MMADAKKFDKKYFILLLDIGIVPVWWGREAHKIIYFTISQLFEYSLEVVGKQEETVVVGKRGYRLRPQVSKQMPRVGLK